MAAWEFLLKDLVVKHDEPIVVTGIDDAYEPLSVDEREGLDMTMRGDRRLRIVFAKRRD